MYSTNSFSFDFFRPKYILTWFGIGILFLLVQLPYSWLVYLGKKLGHLSRFFLNRRKKIIKKNLELCFPEKSSKEIDALVMDNFAALGVALFETGMAWFWSDKRIKKIFTVKGGDKFSEAVNKERGVMIIGIHSMSLELGGRIMGACYPVNAVYRPHNNKVMEYIQTKGRKKSGKGMIDRKNLKFMIHELKSGKAIWFAPDQDFGVKGTLFAPFFAVKDVSTSKGPSIIANLSKSVVLTMTVVRTKGKTPYELIIGPEFEGFPTGSEQLDANFINNIIELEIMRAPEQYLWAHRRFKTRPKGEDSYYTHL